MGRWLELFDSLRGRGDEGYVREGWSMAISVFKDEAEQPHHPTGTRHAAHGSFMEWDRFIVYNSEGKEFNVR